MMKSVPTSRPAPTDEPLTSHESPRFWQLTHLLARPRVDVEDVVEAGLRSEVGLVRRHRLLDHLRYNAHAAIQKESGRPGMTLSAATVRRVACGPATRGRTFGIPKKSNCPPRKSSFAISLAALSAHVMVPPWRPAA